MIVEQFYENKLCYIINIRKF